MESRQAIVDYIAQHLGAGHSEARLREHLATHGWEKTAINQAFDEYHKQHLPKASAMKTARRKYRVPIPRWTWVRWVKLGVTFAVLGGLLFVAHLVLPDKPAEAVPPPPLTFAQRQTQDIILVGGAVALFVRAEGSIPTSTSVAPDGNLVLCGKICDPATEEVSSLQTFKPEGVKFMAYSSGLIVPNKDTMFLVPGATCDGTTAIGNPSAAPRAMVILYGQVNNDELDQRCVKL
ncbi:MAG TPA: hypothetical protein VLF40_06325 [Candidatus Saccharimonadales bacterium]|nr:hypothetical protein [Candidatus Saccharimonadales bacterium]